MTDVSSQPKNPERLELEQLTALQPGLARLMPEIGARFWKAFYAARASQLAARELAAPRDAQAAAALRGDPAEVHDRHRGVDRSMISIP